MPASFASTDYESENRAAGNPLRFIALEKRSKKLLAEAMLDNVVLKDLASKKWCRPALTGKPSPMLVNITG